MMMIDYGNYDDWFNLKQNEAYGACAESTVRIK